MKKLMITLTIVFTLSLAGILYGTNVQPDERENVDMEQLYSNYFPDELPELLFEPIPSFILY